jgi:hypothetical protein
MLRRGKTTGIDTDTDRVNGECARTQEFRSSGEEYRIEIRIQKPGILLATDTDTGTDY